METELPSPPDLQRLLTRLSEIQSAMRRPGGIRITVERELHAIREQLSRHPSAALPLAGGARADATAGHAPQS